MNKQKPLVDVKRSALPNNTGYDDRIIIRENALFEKFYKLQKIVPENEWDQFMASLKSDLPSSFRLVAFRQEAQSLKDMLHERYISKMKDLVIDDKPIEPPFQLPWYPGGWAYQFNMSRQFIRKSDLLSEFHGFLVSETEMGYISRQETVSMIPPLLLDIQPDSKVLDMCAAPGSKTAQAIEMLHGRSDSIIPDGFVLANDFDNKRTYLLVHQSLKRLNSPCCLISNMDARFMPNIELPSCSNKKPEILRFDRIICDVPCSGDGTLRKNGAIWRSWSLYNAYNLHRMQFSIARRGLEMLAVNGLMVYSTCSLNPAEDEAVIAKLLEHFGGAVSLVDISDKLPGLKRHPGLLTWTIIDKLGNTYASASEVPKDAKQIPDVVFPPPESSAKAMHLDRCIRILPHDQDTGGFFVALLRKEKDIGGCSATSVKAEDDIPGNGEVEEKKPSADSDASPARKKFRFQGYREDPFIFFDDADPWWHKVREHFEINDNFPIAQMLYRSSEQKRKRNVYFVNEIAKKIIQNNDTRIKFINAGLRLFGRTDSRDGECHFRLAQEGLCFMIALIGKRLVNVESEDDMAKILVAPNVFLNDLSEPTRVQLEPMTEGSVALKYDRGDQSFCVSAWRGKVTTAAYATQETRLHLLRLLNQDTSALEKEMIRQRKNQQKSRPPDDEAIDCESGTQSGPANAASETNDGCERQNVIMKVDI